MNKNIEDFLASKTYAVAGASANPEKYGNKVLKALIKSGRETYPLNPTTAEIEGHTSYPSVAELPVVPDALSIITPPPVTRQVVAEAIAAASNSYADRTGCLA